MFWSHFLAELIPLIKPLRTPLRGIYFRAQIGFDWPFYVSKLPAAPSAKQTNVMNASHPFRRIFTNRSCRTFLSAYFLFFLLLFVSLFNFYREKWLGKKPSAQFTLIGTAVGFSFALIPFLFSSKKVFSFIHRKVNEPILCDSKMISFSVRLAIECSLPMFSVLFFALKLTLN